MGYFFYKIIFDFFSLQVKVNSQNCFEGKINIFIYLIILKDYKCFMVKDYILFILEFLIFVDYRGNLCVLICI